MERLSVGASYYKPVDDPGMIRAFNFVLRRRTYAGQHGDKLANQVCGRNWPVVHQAFAVSEDTKLRPIVEARILASQSDHEISGVTGISVESIGQFAEIFFDVRDRLEYSDFIQTHVIGLFFGSGAMNDNALALRHMAYNHGPTAVDMLISGRSVKTPDMSLNEVVDMRLREAANLQALLATSAMRPAKFDVRTMLEASSRNYEQDLRPRGTNEQSQWITLGQRSAPNCVQRGGPSSRSVSPPMFATTGSGTTMKRLAATTSR